MVKPWAAAAKSAVPITALLQSRVQFGDASLPCAEVLTVTQCVTAIVSGLIFVLREVWLRFRFLQCCEAEEEVPTGTALPRVPVLRDTARALLRPADSGGTLTAAGPVTPRLVGRRWQLETVGTSTPDTVEPEDRQPIWWPWPRGCLWGSEIWLVLAAIHVLAIVLLWHVSQGLYVLPSNAGQDSTGPGRDWQQFFSQLPHMLHGDSSPRSLQHPPT